MTIFIKRPNDAEEKQKIFSFLYEIWANELHHDTPEMDHRKRTMRDDLDKWATHFLATDETGKIVGCMRNNHFSNGSPPPEMWQHLHLSSLFRLFGRRNVAYTSRLAIEPISRGKTVTSQLFMKGYQDALLSQIDIAVCYAALHLVHLYFQLGFRPYAPPFNSSLGTRIPLVLCVRDRAYLGNVESPFFKMLPESSDDRGKAAIKLQLHFHRFIDPGFDKHSQQLLWAQIAHLSTVSDNPNSIDLFEGISQKELSQALVNPTHFIFETGESVENRNEVVSCMGILLSGRLGIGMIRCDKPKIASIIHPGEPFGEFSVLDLRKRALDIIALEKSEVVFLPLTSLRRLLTTGDGIGERFTRNLLRILSHRMHTDQQTIASLIEGKDHEVHLRRISLPPAAISDDFLLSESYGYETLADKSEEYERLKLQATISENVEISKLKQIGLNDGDTIVDVGAGPGMVSTLLARYYPNSKIIGVEPNDDLRENAILSAKRQELSHCSFIKGAAEQIPLENNSIDFCYARLLFQHLPNPRTALREMNRITKPGGLVAVLDVDDAFILTYPEIPGWSQLQGLVAQTQRNNGGNRHIGRELLGLMLDTGLHDVHVEAIPFTIRELGGHQFFRLVFGFKKQILERAGQLRPEYSKVFETAKSIITKPSTFAIVVTIFAHGRSYP